MGFHKRYINDDQIIDMYRRHGCQRVIDWYTKGADAIITSGNLASEVSSMINILRIDHEKGWNRISEVISSASIEKGFGS